MSKVKVSELSGVELDWAVAQAEGQEVEFEDGELRLPSSYFKDGGLYTPSTDWAQGGPIIEREGILLEPQSDHWDATLDNGDYVFWRFGSTPLIAAMRCYVASKLGDEIEVPMKHEYCPACETDVDAVDGECQQCGQPTQPMKGETK